MLKVILLFLLNAEVYANDLDDISYQKYVEQYQQHLQQEQELRYQQQILNNQQRQIMLQLDENERQERENRSKPFYDFKY